MHGMDEAKLFTEALKVAEAAAREFAMSQTESPKTNAGFLVANQLRAFTRGQDELLPEFKEALAVRAGEYNAETFGVKKT